MSHALGVLYITLCVIAGGIATLIFLLSIVRIRQKLDKRRGGLTNVIGLRLPFLDELGRGEVVTMGRD